MVISIILHPPFCSQSISRNFILELKQNTISADKLIGILNEKGLFNDTYFDSKVDWYAQMILLRNKSIINSEDIIFDNDTIQIYSPLVGG